MELINQIDESFKFENKEIRIIGSYNEPYFVAKDICNVLGLSNITEALKSIPQKWKKIENLTSVSLKSDIMYQEQGRNMIILTEPAVYKLIMRSNKAIAQKFQEVVCEEILPSLRKKGEFKLKELVEEKEKIIKIKEEEKIRLEEEKNKEIKKLQNKVFAKQKRTVYDNKNFIYMVQDEFHKKERIYVIGKAIDLSQRLTSYNKTREHEVVYYRCCNSAQQMAYIEKCVLSKLDKYREVSNRDRFILPDDEPVSLFTDVIDLFVNCFSDVDPSVDIEKNLTEDEIEMQKKEAMKEYIEDHRELITYHKSDYREDNKDQFYNFQKVYQENNKERIEEYQQQYRKDNNDALKTYNKKYYQENKEGADAVNRNYKQEHLEEMKEYNKEYYEENKEEFKKYKKEQYEKNKEAIIEESKKYYQENKEHVLDRVKDHYKQNKEKILAYQQEKIICECGMKIQRNYSAKHKKSEIHKISLENKLKNEPVQTTFKCECGHEIKINYTKRHMNSKIHKIAMELKSKTKTI